MTRVKRGDNIEKIHYGPEPEWNGVDYSDREELLWVIQKAMNWYHAMSSSNKNKKWYLDYLMKNGVKKTEIMRYSHESKANYDAVGGYCRMYLLGLDLPEEILNRINNFTETIKSNYARRRISTEEKIEKVEVLSIQDRIRNQVSDLCFILDQKFDAFIEKLKNKESVRGWNMSDFCRENKVKKPQAKLLHEYFKPQMDEIRLAYDKVDKDIKEGWSFLTRPNLRKLLVQYEDVINHCEQVINHAPKRRQAKRNPDRMIKNLRYAKTFGELDLVSKNPKKLIDSKFIVLYNTKTRELTILESFDKKSTMYIKGTTVFGHCEKKSKKKVVRKPENFIKSLQNSSKRVILDEFNRLGTKESLPSTRMNPNTIILQVL